MVYFHILILLFLKKKFLIVSSHSLYCQVISYLFLLLLAELSRSNRETETTKWLKQEKLNIELFSHNRWVTINYKENADGHPRAGGEYSGKESLWRGDPSQSWSLDLSTEDMIAASWSVDTFAGLPGPELVPRHWASRTRPCGAQSSWGWWVDMQK